MVSSEVQPPPSETRSDATQAPASSLSPGVAVAVRGLGRSYGPFEALRDLDFELPAGAVTVLLGANGAGKTTLLHVLATRLRPSAGQAWVAGLDVRRDPAAVRARIGLVGHGPMLYPELSAEENLAYFARLHGVPHDQEACRAALERVGLRRQARERARHLSRGMRQRLALARATLHEPAVLLLDEPFAGLDAAAGEALEERVRAAAREGRAVLLATHDLGRASRLADRALVLRIGRLRWSGPAAGWDEAAWRALHRACAQGERGGGAMPAHVPSPPATGPDSGSEEARPAPVDALPPPRGATLVAVARAVATRDVRTELRAKEILPTSVFFALISAVLLGQAAPGTATDLARIAPGAVWVSLLLASTLGLSRTIVGEAEGGGLAGTLASPADRGAIFLGKWLAAWLHACLVGWLLLPVVVALYGLSPGVAGLAAAAATVALGAAGWTAAGVLLSCAALAARAREMLLPVLLYPLALPLVLPAVGATAVFLGAPSTAGEAGIAGGALLLVGAYALIYLVLGFLLFPFVADAA